MTAPRLLLYNPRSSANGKPVLPMSLLALGATLDGRHDYRIVDGNLENRPVDVLDAALEAAGEEAVLAVTVMPGPQLEQAVPLCRELKARRPGVTVVWGGYFPSQHWDACVVSDCVDFVVRGHGELILPELIDHLGRGTPALEDIRGLAWCGEGGPRTNAPAPIPHPDELPPWNLDRVPMERYLRDTFLGRRTIGYSSSYGCPYFCNFCAVVTMVSGRWLAQSAARVASAVEEYRVRWGVDAIEFVDNNFFVHEERVGEVSDRIRGLGVAWWGEGRIDTMLRFSPATWRAMRDSGLRMVFLGAESGSKETLARMDKGGRLTPELTLELVRLMAEYGIVPELSFVLGNPPDPEGDAVDTMEFIRRVKRINPATEIIMYLYTPVPLDGTLYEEARSSGFAFPRTLDEWVSADWLDFAQRRSGAVPWIRASLQRRIRSFERVLNAYYPTTTMTGLTRPKRALLRAAAAWRYHSRIYRWPIELGALHRVVAYQRPETSGF